MSAGSHRARASRRSALSGIERAEALMRTIPSSVAPCCSSCRPLLPALLLLLAISAAKAQQPFNTPEEAVDALVGAVKAGDQKRILTVLGRDATDIVSSGD